MNIRLLSDIHLEFYDLLRFNNTKLFKSFVEADEQSKIDDVLVLAGDICSYKHSDKLWKFLDWCSEKFYHVIYIFGNHEFYEHDYVDTKREIKSITKTVYKNISVLDLEEQIEEGFIDLFGVRFIGSTLWTDFNQNDLFVKQSIKQELNDFWQIYNEGRLITPEFIYDKNQKTLLRLNVILLKTKIPSVVITHHAPHELSRDYNYPFDDISYAFFNTKIQKNLLSVSDNRTFLWLHGHVHHNVDYVIPKKEYEDLEDNNSIHVLSNTAGYPIKDDTENQFFSKEFQISIFDNGRHLICCHKDPRICSACKCTRFINKI